MKKVYRIYGCTADSEGIAGREFFIIDTKDFGSEKEAEEFLLKAFKPVEDYSQFYFIAPTYKFLPLDSE